MDSFKVVGSSPHTVLPLKASVTGPSQFVLNWEYSCRCGYFYPKLYLSNVLETFSDVFQFVAFLKVDVWITHFSVLLLGFTLPLIGNLR